LQTSLSSAALSRAAEAETINPNFGALKNAFTGTFGEQHAGTAEPQAWNGRARILPMRQKNQWQT
jgi:hypothetical protein